MYSDAKEQLRSYFKKSKAAGPALNGLLRCARGIEPTAAVAIAVHSALFLNSRMTGHPCVNCAAQ